MEDFIFEKPKHGFFDELVSYFASISSLGTNFELQKTGRAEKWLPEHYLTIEGIKSVTNCEIRFYPHDTLNEISINSWPNKIRLQKAPLTKNIPEHPIVLNGIQKLHGSMIQSAFIHFYERYVSEVKLKFGENTMNWPAVWNFGRVIRNAFAHGGEIKIENPNSPKVSWSSLEYDSTFNGRNIMYKDITPVETIFLMDEMDKQRR
ncbi:hypothetical protein [Daejeonella sp.]|uniref:hypothetical protein n=1 Tax=Daejeonella sp. TaxID=2805397 RepID=UPI0025BC0158|nr:hypothetical protein [Daejeonella sp.]